MTGAVSSRAVFTSRPNFVQQLNNERQQDFLFSDFPIESILGSSKIKNEVMLLVKYKTINIARVEPVEAVFKRDSKLVLDYFTNRLPSWNYV